MKSFCIKTNYQPILTYLLKQIPTMNLDSIYYSENEFRIYKNIILHYTGNYEDEFEKRLTKILKNCILLFYEESILKQILKFNYFYFDEYEQDKILETCLENMHSNINSDYLSGIQSVESSIWAYLHENNSMILDGFVRFRLGNYRKNLDAILDQSVNQYIIEKEYTEFISLLKLYISTKESKNDFLHLIYFNKESIILDENKNIVSTLDNIFNAKYLSDISFSSNDYALNTLLTLLPEKIYIHLIDEEDEFIHTLKLIFENRCLICTDCDICKTYSLLARSYST